MKSSVFGEQKPKARKLVAKKPTPETTEPDAEPKTARKNASRVNFVRRNIDGAACSRNRQKVVPSVSRKEAILNAVHEPGTIPSAVSQRRKDLIARKVPPNESDCQAGMRLLSDEEKEIETRIESQTLIRRHRELEQEFQDIDRSMDQLKRKYVFGPE
jgi:hypothetical protein